MATNNANNVTSATFNAPNTQQQHVTTGDNNNLSGVQNRTNLPNGEPLYESYFEDSFVNELEECTEEDVADIAPDEIDEDCQDEGLNPSTLEFDFDSFGPESFIFTPGPRYSSMRKKVLPNRELLSQEPVTPTESNGPVKQIDLKVIEPYKKVISHAGYCHHHNNPALHSLSPSEGEPAPAIIVFSACYLPDRSRRDYSYVMDHLFLYVLTSLHELVADDYILIYLHNSRPQENNLPTFSCLKRCYHMIDRRLRKNLKALYLVQPTFWLKTIVVMCKPFISSKFSRKLRFIESIEDLKQYLPIDQLVFPQSTSSTT